MYKTDIEYLDMSWNPIVMKCTRVSEGCNNCWHLAHAHRLSRNPTVKKPQREIYKGEAPFAITQNKKKLYGPISYRRPSIMGVQFMGDLFHEGVSFADILHVVIDVINKSTRHIFIILTKRDQRLLEFTKWAADELNVEKYSFPDNVWVGVTIENKKYKSRAETLKYINASVRLISYEPTLGPFLLEKDWKHIDWVIAGCESINRLPSKRHAKLEWFRNIKNQCTEMHIPFFLKQMENQYGVLEKLPILSGQIWVQFPKVMDYHMNLRFRKEWFNVAK